MVSFRAEEAQLLHSMIGELRELIDAPDPHGTDPLEQLTGITAAAEPLSDSADPAAPGDPAAARLFPDGYRDDPTAAAELRRLTEGNLRARKDDAAARFAARVPDGGGKVRLDPDDTATWLTAINDLRLVLGTRLGVTEDSDPLGGHRPGSEQAAPYLIYHWLTGLQDELITRLGR